MRIRFSIRTTLVLMVLLAAGLYAYLAYQDHQRFQEHAINWAEVEDLLSEYYENLFWEEDRAEISQLDLAKAVAIIQRDSDFHRLDLTRFWAVQNREAIIPELVSMVTDRSEPGLTNSADLAIEERIHAGDMKAYGHGWSVEDDLFRVAGRASWILKEITGYQPGDVSMTSSAEHLERLQLRWKRWVRKYSRRLYRLPSSIYPRSWPADD